MVARLQVAALDHNYSVDRQQATTKEGVLRFSKAARAFVVKPIKEEKTWCFRSELLHGIVDCYANVKRWTAGSVPCLACQKFERVKTVALELKPLKVVSPWHMIGRDWRGHLQCDGGHLQHPRFS
ncbi:hypothetical protein J4Q44_G00009040 [Coregonus suidteri]|uniref:Uncharacterized protein n=1 Tax=Coregonus suidteri TaxID=861788 RepID=A0AAN8R873_9TELE